MTGNPSVADCQAEFDVEFETICTITVRVTASSENQAKKRVWKMLPEHMTDYYFEHRRNFEQKVGTLSFEDRPNVHIAIDGLDKRGKKNMVANRVPLENDQVISPCVYDTEYSYDSETDEAAEAAGSF